MTKRIAYKKGYKYQLQHDYFEHIPIQPEQDIKTDFLLLDVNGNLVVKKGYAWDGVSGGAPDLNGFMRGSLKHDAIYQLIRMGLLDMKWRVVADAMFARDSKQDGIWGFVATTANKLLRAFGKRHASNTLLKRTYYAP